MGDSLRSDNLRIVSPFSVYSGYAVMGRAVLRTALLAGYNVSAIESDLRVRVTRWVDDGRTTWEPHIPDPPIPLPPMQEPELRDAQKVRLPDGTPTLMIQTPWNLCNWPHYGSGPLIGYTMTESDNLCYQWQHGMRNVDMAIAPSTYVHRTFQWRAQRTPSVLLPIPVDHRVWEACDAKAEIRERPEFLFVSVFNVCERKMWRQLMVAFAEEFKGEGDRVGLIVKASPPEPVVQLADCCREMGAWVRVDHERRNWWGMGALYNACQVYVCPASEGFGLPIVEAAYCGLPSIALDKGGAADIVNEHNGYVCPSHMAPIVGHMPQWYDRKTDRFAVFEIDDMRAALRRAYEEETAGAKRGEVAKNDVYSRFTPEAIAPMLREAVERGVEVHREAIRTTRIPEKPLWATVAGAWGDVFCAIGNIREMMAEKQIGTIGVIWYGRDPKIADWLRLQPWIRELIAIHEPDKKTMTLTYGRLCQVKPQYAVDEWTALLAANGHTLRGEIAYTQLCLAEVRPPKYWHDPVLSKEAYEWARNIADCVDGEFLLVNPLSVASNTMKDHWPYWGPALQMMLDTMTYKIVLVGENLIDWEPHPHLVNVSGQSRSMQDVLALAELANGIVTTGNNLGHYAIICGKPAVVAFARTCPKSSFYHKFNEHPLLSLVEFEEPMADFERALHERFGQYCPIATGRSSDKDHPSEKEFYGEEPFGRTEGHSDQPGNGTRDKQRRKTNGFGPTAGACNPGTDRRREGASAGTR